MIRYLKIKYLQFALTAILLVFGFAYSNVFALPLDCSGGYAHFSAEQLAYNQELQRVQELIAKRKANIAYPGIPSVQELHLPKSKPALLQDSHELSAGLADPLLEEARALGAFEDFMPLSVARVRSLTAKQKKILTAQANAVAKKELPENQRRAFLKAYIEKAYDFSSELKVVSGLEKPRWKSNSGSSIIDATFAYTEKMWDGLLRKTKPAPKSSLLDLPYPMLVPGGRFQETYYWDTYFGMKGLLATGRLELAQMQVENLLHLVQRYGFVPNGTRDFYLTRSQPPFLSSAVKEVFEASLKNAKTEMERKQIYKWLNDRAMPLVQKDYDNFWMNPETRFDKKTGLNHHWDDANLPRPERHGNDNEHTLGKTFRDVRAGAESGLDFTDAHEGQSAAIAPVLLNSLLYKVEADLAWMAKLTGDTAEAKRFGEAAQKRAGAMRKYLLNKEKGRFDNFNLNTGQKIDATVADTFAPLFVGMASKSEAELLQRVALPKLEREYGIMASDLMNSHHQWDGSNGWAPHQVMAVAGLKNYNFTADATRLARKWVSGIAKLHEENKTIYERIDVVTGGKPIKDETKYPTQEGFLWTNGSFTWMLFDILGVPKAPL